MCIYIYICRKSKNNAVRYSYLAAEGYYSGNPDEDHNSHYNSITKKDTPGMFLHRELMLNKKKVLLITD